MVYKITGEQPFQVLSDSFSISPSEQNYIVQVSADGTNYSDLFAVSAGQTKMCTGMSNGSFYRLKNNQSEVSVNWRTTCKGGEGGGGSYILPPATQQTLGGVKVGSGLTVQADGTLSANGGGGSVDNTILKSVTAFPVSAETGDVVALSSETGETITFNVSDVVFGEGADILEISGDGLHTLTGNAFYDAENQVNVLKFAIGTEEDYLVEDGSSIMFPASTNDELIWEWKAELNNGVVTVKLYDEDNEAYLPLSTSNISLNACDAKVNGTFVGVYQYDGTSWNEIGGSSAYKIELSTDNPEDFTQEDIANLEAFCAAADADPSIEEGAYLFINSDIYRNTLIDVRDLQEGKLQHYIFSYADVGFIYSIQVSFEDGVYFDGSHYAWYGETLFPYESFPADPLEGQIANYDDGNGNIGLYRFDGTDWVPFGGGDNSSLIPTTGFPSDPVEGQIVNYSDERLNVGVLYRYDGSNWQPYGGGDNTVLKAVSGAPATLEKGDVYALNAPFVAPEAPNGQTVYGGNITDFKAAIDDNNNQIWVNTWDDAQHTELTNQGYFELDKNGDIAFYDYQGDYYYTLMDYYDRKGEWIQCNGVYIRWEGENLYFYVNQEGQGVNFNPDVDMNFDSVGSTLGVYQANFKAQPNVKIEVDGDAHIDGTAEAPEQVVTNSIGHMLVSFNNPSIVDGKVCELESYGDYYPLVYNDVNNRWALYSTDGETTLVEVGNGQSRNADFGDGNVYLSYSDGVLTAYTDYEKGWKNWNMGDGGEVLDPEELAKVSQLPAENRLITAPQSYDNGRYLYTDGTNTSWNNAPSPEQYWGYPYEDSTAPVFSTSTWSVGWRKVVQSQDVKNIVKITVSDYETLVQQGATDPSTLYLTYEPQA